MEPNKKTKLNDEMLEAVAGGRTGFDFGPPAAQVDTVPAIMPLLLHRDAMLAEDENTRNIPGIADRP